ncbi:acyl-CoA dehydrogenase/oxidase C-terminal [Schizophyllum amplum]|uniref:Acyl-CoA dehydrogenase/oxidase C-terminal n=1 Tax=Schizophyllum amplum TaxID=97359 RepID=A0A550CGY3_9AGAR|nr:acyl-CoA dehydrogenase/oxidase C-terminal [Auriculariopsis ampla]
MRVEQGFQIPPYEEGNPFSTDPVLPSLLKRTLPELIFREIQPDLVRLGDDISTVIRDIHRRGEISDPSVDRLQTSEGWRKLKAISQKEGIPGIFYERKHGSLLPISMTDGCARVIELAGSPAMKRDVFPRLVSRDPEQAFTAGQWMTERPGGSDVSQTETFAWFSSATDSDVALALGRSGAPGAGSRGPLALPCTARMPLLRDNNIFVHRLKNKFGTKTLPTAELSLEGAEGYRIGPENQGVKLITPVLNITRVWSAVHSASALRRCLAIATSYARVRKIQGGTQLLQDAPLHVSQLASINLTYRALTHFVFGVVSLLGKSECETTSADERHLLRIMTPTVKAFAAEKATAAMEEAMTALGGNGYMEENDLGRLIRDGLVERIWEGTTTVLSLDLARAMRGDAVNAFSTWAGSVLDAAPPSTRQRLMAETQTLRTCIEELGQCFAQMTPLVPRPALMLMGCTLSSLFFSSMRLADLDTEVFSRWVQESGLDLCLQAVRRSRLDVQHRTSYDTAIVFGAAKPSKL